QLLENEDGTNLAILVVGWHKDKYHNFVMYQVEIKHGKVKILADNTDSSIAERLEELGISASDIIFTYLEPEFEKGALELV
ncbi:MAG: element excision factor XisI family protein, partial [Bacteroidota bacterium]